MCPYVSYYGISSERNAQFQEGAIELMRLTNRKLKDIPPNMILIGNGLTHSTNPTMNYCRSVLNYTDGAMIEHFGAFEEVDTSTSMIYTDYWLDWIDIIYNETQLNNKFICMKSWVGPEYTPVTSIGPSWPDSFKYQTPQNYSDIAKHATELLQFPFGFYLCALLNEYVYFSYAWWYGWYQGYYPCQKVNECSPSNWMV